MCLCVMAQLFFIFTSKTWSYKSNLEHNKATHINKVPQHCPLSYSVSFSRHITLIFRSCVLSSCRPQRNRLSSALRCIHNAMNYSLYPSASTEISLADWQRGCSGICQAQQSTHCSRNSDISSYSSVRLKETHQRRNVCLIVCLHAACFSKVVYVKVCAQ